MTPDFPTKLLLHRALFARRMAQIFTAEAFSSIPFHKRTELFQHFVNGDTIVVRFKSDPDLTQFLISIKSLHA
jgi:hypothetical protein